MSSLCLRSEFLVPITAEHGLEHEATPVIQLNMNEIADYVASVAKFFKLQLGASLTDVYKLGSLAHGGFSQIYSDIDIGLLLNSTNPPEEMDRMSSEAKEMEPQMGKRLSVFWANPVYHWGRLPILDRIDLLDHGVPLLTKHKANFKRPDKADIHRSLLESVDKSWKPRAKELSRLTELEPKNYKPYVRSLLYPARLIFSWDRLQITSNDTAVEYLREIKPPGLDLYPMELALECRNDRCRPDKVFSEKVDLENHLQNAISYISKQ